MREERGCAYRSDQSYHSGNSSPQYQSHRHSSSSQESVPSPSSSSQSDDASSMASRFRLSPRFYGSGTLRSKLRRLISAHVKLLPRATRVWWKHSSRSSRRIAIATYDALATDNPWWVLVGGRAARAEVDRRLRLRGAISVAAACLVALGAVLLILASQPALRGHSRNDLPIASSQTMIAAP